ncbi:TPA: SCP2 sterol-binding domain-containing protein [Pseudomonas aeruginosa]
MSDEIITEGLKKVLEKGTLGAVARVEFNDGSAIVITSTADKKDLSWDSAETGVCQLLCSKATFIDLMTGRVGPTIAFMKGQLKVKGDMAVALKLSQMI